MKVHLVIAHPEKRSFNFALHQTAIDTITNENFSLCISDLYADNFAPAASQFDIFDFPSKEYFNLANAQRWAHENNAFVVSIKREQEKIKSSDVLILQFPLWWWSFPAILKGWVDRVLTSGFAYGKGSTLTPRKVMYSITTGGANNKEEHEYYMSKINGLYQDVFGFMGWEVIPPFIAHGVQQKTQEERSRILVEYSQHLMQQVIRSGLVAVNC